MDRDDQSVDGPWPSLAVTERVDAARITVHDRPAILGVREGMLDVALKSPPAEGAANAEVHYLIARELETRRGNRAIVAGPGFRRKVIEGDGITGTDVRALCGDGDP